MYKFPNTLRYFSFKYFLNVWEKCWHESTLQENSKNHKINMLFSLASIITGISIISSVKFLEFSFEYFPQYVYSFPFLNNLVQHKENVFKATSTLVKNKRNFSPA